MDEQRCFQVEHDDNHRHAMNMKCNLRLCVDGGRRCETQGALGFALYSVHLDEHGVYVYKLLARHGRLLRHISSFFLAEALALEWSLEYLIGLLRTVT